MTDDGRFLIFNAWDSPTAKTNRLVAADVEKGTFREIPVGKSRVPIPYLDTKAAHVYWFDENGLHRFDLRGDKNEAEIVCPYPADLGPMHNYGTHLTLSEDRKTVFLDMRRRRKDIWVQGVLHIDTGRFEIWSETPHQMNHGQINPKNDRLAICAREYEWQGFDGKTHKVHGNPCTKGCPRMWLIEPGKRTWVEPQNGQHATHENWADDGKGLYWCANGSSGVWYHELASGRQSCLCPRRAVHASMDVSNRYVAFDNAIGARYRGNAWQVGFWNRETGVGIYPFTRMDPLMPDKKHASTQHPDPHPQFVMGGQYIVCTLNNADGHMDTAVIPVAPLVAKTAAAFAPAKILGEWPAGTDPATISRRLNEQLLSTRVEAYAPKGMIAKRGNYGNGRVMYCGASLMAHGLDCARLAGQQDIEERLLARFQELMATKDRKVFPKPGHVDDTIAGALPLEVAYLTGDGKARSFGLSFADAQWSRPNDLTTKSKQNLPLDEQEKLFKKGYTPETRYWIDDMYMITFLQVQAYRATGDIKYLNRAAKEMALYITRLQRPDGLFNHAPDVPFVWGRGDGWVAGGLTLLMTYLPESNPDYLVVQEGYLKMMNALLRHQRKDGLWGQLVDDPESWAETSGSAMFAFGFVTGVKRGLLDADRFGPAARKAYLALVGKLDEHANLADVCDGTVKKNDRQHYLDRPRVNGAPYGQAALMWICNALLDGAGLPLALVSPKEGEEFCALQPEQRAFLDMDGAARRKLFLDTTWRAHVVKDVFSRPLPLKLKWHGGTPPYAVRVELDGRCVFFTNKVHETSVDVWNLEIGRAYAWSVDALDGSAGGTFRTRDQAPRLIHAPDVANIRDIGGWHGIDGRRIRQGMAYRSGGLNNNAHVYYNIRETLAFYDEGVLEARFGETGRKLKEQIDREKAQGKFNPKSSYLRKTLLKRRCVGQSRLVEDGLRIVQDDFGWRSDIDLRSDAECWGMSSSPAGRGVKWFHIPFQCYAGMGTEEGRAAFTRAFRVLLDVRNYPLDFHCIGGADRTGSLAFVVEALLGVSDDDLARDWEFTCFVYEDQAFGHKSRYDQLRAVIDACPGATTRERAEAYVRSCGFTDADIATLRTILLEN